MKITHIKIFLSFVSVFVLAILSLCGEARADFIISSAIVEFTSDGPRQQDIDIVSRSKDTDYVESDITEVIHPGDSDESRRAIDDPAQGMLLVTPNKTVLAGGSRRTLRFVLLKDPDTREHIYRVAVKPVIRGVDNNSKVGLKVLIGYEVLIIVRPAQMSPAYTAKRQGKTLHITNTGNTSILFQNGKQCSTPEQCTMTPVIRVYPGRQATIDLPSDAPVTYAVWNGIETADSRFN